MNSKFIPIAAFGVIVSIVGYALHLSKKRRGYDGVLQTKIEGRAIELHSDELVCQETAVQYITSMKESFCIRNGKLFGKCPCTVRKDGKFTSVQCYHIVDITKVLSQLPKEISEKLGKLVDIRTKRAIREEILRKKKGATDCPFCIDPELDRGIGLPLNEIMNSPIWKKNFRNCRQCNTCGKIWCCKCGCPYLEDELTHEWLTCEEVESIRKGADPNHVVIKSMSKKCPKCGANVNKKSGCDHMTCRCGQQFCYKCGGAYLPCRMHGGQLCHHSCNRQVRRVETVINTILRFRN